MLELDDDQLMCDSLAIVAFLSRIHEQEEYIGKSVEDQNQQVVWMKFMRETSYPKI